MVTSYPAQVWQPNCVANREHSRFPPEFPLFSQRVLVALDNGQGVVHAPASGWDRIYLLWTFRNFRSLPQNVLRPRQQQLVLSLYREASHYPSLELRDAVVVGTVEDFRPSSLPLPSVTVRKQVAGEKKSPHASTRASKPFHCRFAFDRRALSVGAVAVVLLIAILAWHQLGAQPVTSGQIVAAVPQTSEPIAIASETRVKDATQTVPAPAIAEPASSAIPPASTNINSEIATTQRWADAPAVQWSVAPPAPGVPTSITAPRAHRLIALSQPNDATASLHHPAAASPKTNEAAADQPRMQISGRPRKLVYPVCPETQARGKVSLQAVVGYDGAVSRVRVLTGDRALAAAAVAAVRQWRYAPFSGTAPHQERETHITISFISTEVVAVSFPSSAPLSR
jgi:outer membrane biosynthesis protein TonB